MAENEYVEAVLGDLFDAGAEPRVRVAGVGGAGGNVVSALSERELQGMETVVVNADRSGLERARADRKVHLEVAEASEEAVAEAAEADPALREAMAAEIAFVVAGLGGVAGSGAIRPVCRAARDQGAVVIAIAILPFQAEGRRRERAEALVEGLRADCDTVLIVDNESIVKFDGAGSFRDAFGLVNQMVCRLVTGVLEQVRKDFYTTLAEEVETVARTLEEQSGSEVAVSVVAPPDVVEAQPDLTPVAFDSTGFIGWK
ncbi:MAG TPA: hypothetical protein VJ397_05325 [Thermoplasmata archaeon]|nr:hypothetical protein [Thermoplasmata archaeon]